MFVDVALLKLWGSGYHSYGYDLLRVLRFEEDSRYGVFWTLPVEIGYYLIIPLYSAVVISTKKYWWVLNAILLPFVLHDGFYNIRRPHQSLAEHLPTFLTGSIFAVYFLHTKHYLTNTKNTIFHRIAFQRAAKISSSFLLVLMFSDATGRVFFRWIMTKITFGPPDYSYYISLPISMMIFLELNYPSWISKNFAMPLLQFYGKISYSMYLIHLPIFKLLNNESDPMDKFFFNWIVVTALSYCSYIALEKPIMSVTDRICLWLKAMESKRGIIEISPPSETTIICMEPDENDNPSSCNDRSGTLENIMHCIYTDVTNGKYESIDDGKHCCEQKPTVKTDFRPTY